MIRIVNVIKMHYPVHTFNGKSHCDTQKFLCCFKCNTAIFLNIARRKETNNVENKSPLLLILLQLSSLWKFYYFLFFLDISSYLVHIIIDKSHYNTKHFFDVALISRNVYSHLLDFPISKESFRVNHNYAIDHQLLWY